MTDPLHPPASRATEPPDPTLYIVTRRDCQDVMAVYGTEADATHDVEMRESGGSLGRYRWEKWNVPLAVIEAAFESRLRAASADALAEALRAYEQDLRIGSGEAIRGIVILADADAAAALLRSPR